MTWWLIVPGLPVLWMAVEAVEYWLGWREDDRIWQAVCEEVDRNSVQLTMPDGTQQWVYVAPWRAEGRQ